MVGATFSSVDCRGAKAGLVDGANPDARATMRNNAAKDNLDMVSSVWEYE
eukprot:CAMPEP_0117046198 /NCGR_PEP_ID=MMETSP0472-20121206/31949_1 /TAXON_ID=693140 ORGANISM="Tiarina fusus, Strain LIS" /NCGR_SAMPLE_ID=MMETSP0472 /ASSEMBLY_ACC=CAM_ASM_000603 /LENGTH=49 /DNA_ID= /DNA_START= /DNA_END= /DNA_ORIENTATION=